MTDLNLFTIIACSILAAMALISVLWRIAQQIAALQVNDTAQDARLAALEDRVAHLEVPELLELALRKHLEAQALLQRGGRCNGYDGPAEGGRV